MGRAALHAGLAGLVVALGTLLLPDRYRSEARILSDTGHAGAGPGTRTGIWAPTAPPETTSSREDGPTVVYADILRSRRMAKHLLEREYEYGLKAWHFGPSRRVKGSLLDYLGAVNLDRALGPLRKVLTVIREPKSGLLTVRAETRSPELSQQVVRQATECLRDALVELSQIAGKDRARFTQERLEEVRQRYMEIGREFQRFQDGNRNWEISPAPDVRFQGSRLKDRLDLWKQVMVNLTLNHEQALLDAQNDTQTLLVLDPGSLPLEKSGPPRGLLAFVAAAAAAALSLGFRNRAAIAHRLFGKEPTP
jgi:uncharacterized protein involved in exopolysaccharide biosynthesis